MLKMLKYCCLLASFVVVGVLGAQNPAAVVRENAPEKMAQEMLSKLAQGKNDPTAVSKAFTTIIETCKEPAIDVAQLLPCAIVVYVLAAIIHEYARVGALNVFFEVSKSTEVYIGRKRKQPFFSIGHLHFMNFPWIMGNFSNIKLVAASQSGPRKKYDEVNDYTIRQSLKNYEGLFKGIRDSAGGLSAAALLYTCITAICKYCAYVDAKAFSKITLKNLLTGFSPFQTIVQTKALSTAHKRFLLNLTFVMCTAFFFQVIYGEHRVVKQVVGPYGGRLSSDRVNAVWYLNGLLLAVADGVIFKKYYDARKLLRLCPYNCVDR
jgi:hypothetical protein